MDNALLYRQLKLTQDESLDDFVLLIQKASVGWVEQRDTHHQ